MKKSNFSTGRMARLAVLAAILIVMGFTPLGYLRVNLVMEITFNMIPVVIGAVVLGPSGGAILGLIFGLTSFAQALTGSNALGAMLLSQGFVSAILLFVTCVVPRVLAGWIPGLLFRALDKSNSMSRRVIAISLSTLCGSVLNTVFFIAAFIGFFATNDAVTGAFGTTSVWAMITLLLSVNAVVEAIICTVVGSAVGQTMIYLMPRKKQA